MSGLNIVNSDLKLILGPCRNITEISLKRNNNLSDDMFVELSKHVSEIRILRVGGFSTEF